MKAAIDAGLTPEQEQLVADNIGLIRFAVDRFCRGALTLSYDFEDAASEGYFGLCRAAQTWQPDRGSFTTHAVQHIAQTARYGRCRLDGSNWRRFIDGKEARFTNPMSIDLRPGDGGPTFADQLEDRPSDPAEYPQVQALLETCTERERAILLLTLEEAAAVLGVKPASVNRARVRLYARLRQEVAA